MNINVIVKFFIFMGVMVAILGLFMHDEFIGNDTMSEITRWMALGGIYVAVGSFLYWLLFLVLV